ncbi:adenylate/guanylate cyclase domain-containing protein [Enterovirga rhinocerotis]|uniref:Adenylate cyclase n=1 Tax=Enterovirga rhinocerotis TaxID=1339210 RepID=A0A4R7C8I3_9HYPH|nr:adenylate/guanylate cyclase domain-containing protein [Enterovirga rhinocerotis]TDR94681.1 adenylate cyclase [Enterovirga rhinocerotis]
MGSDAAAELGYRITKAGLAGASEEELLRDFCQGALEAGVGISRAILLVDTLHPVHEGHVYHWRDRAPAEITTREYGRTNRGGEAEESWRKSPFYRMLQSGEDLLLIGIDHPDYAENTIVKELKDEGNTQWVILLDRFNEAGTIGELDCLFSAFSTRQPGGFTDDQVAKLRRLAPVLGLAIKAVALGRIAGTLVETYLGRDPGRRVLQGRIERGITDRIEAVLWFSDLRGYTRITGAAPPDQIIPFLNDYADAIISSVEEAGGDVLKLIGDGTLAIFTAPRLADACCAAIRAQTQAFERVRSLNERRNAAELPVTEVYLGLHVGEVFYGNVGSDTRLDFTVVGPAVNEASRIAAMCRSAERTVLASSAFVSAADEDDRLCLVSVGRYALRGIERAQELFTICEAEE